MNKKKVISLTIIFLTALFLIQLPINTHGLLPQQKMKVMRRFSYKLSWLFVTTKNERLRVDFHKKSIILLPKYLIIV